MVASDNISINKTIFLNYRVQDENLPTEADEVADPPPAAVGTLSHDLQTKLNGILAQWDAAAEAVGNVFVSSQFVRFPINSILLL